MARKELTVRSTTRCIPEKLGYLLGIWHNCRTEILKKFRKARVSPKFKSEFIYSLEKIGYCLNNKKKSNSLKIIKAFQRHYRKELINGIIDKECLIIAKNISKKI